MNPKQSLRLFGFLLTFATALATDLMPRQDSQIRKPRPIIAQYHQKGVTDCATFVLSTDRKTLYVGARDTVVALDTARAKINNQKGMVRWAPTREIKDVCKLKGKQEMDCLNFIRVLVQLNDTHLYICGTYAFKPTCAYIDLQTFAVVTDADGNLRLQDGKGVTPYTNKYKNTAILIDGELYAATKNDFQGIDPIITRTLGSKTILKTEQWMESDATFVASINIPTAPDDQKIYFFFSETAKEFNYLEKVVVSRVARVCKNDAGGEKLLQKKWTTFVKATLSCTPEGQLPYSVIQHVFALPHHGGDTVLYAVFTPQWKMGDLWSSAVCAFSLAAINKVFDDGQFKEQSSFSQWMPYEGEVPDPRPGSCSITPTSHNTHSFMRQHYVMNEKIQPIGNRPLLVQPNVKYTQITVHEVHNSLGRTYYVMFLGTDQGIIHKAVIVGNEAYIVEEILLLVRPDAIRSLLLFPEEGILHVGHGKGVLQISVANCGIHKSCTDCIAARDPYCAWNGRRCKEIQISNTNRDNLKQDIEGGRPEIGCSRSSSSSRRSRASPSSITVVVVMTLVFFSFPDNLKMEGPGCRSLSKANKASGQEKLLLRDSQSLPQGSLCQEAANSSKICCVKGGGGSFQNILAKNNCLDFDLAYGEDSRGVVAVEGI
ncbi:semaphorin-4A [Podarcis lilfordi]|uniref:Semaphorin-4A n=1 Tax=Podarcis lilfordi TaxID=74358 RepID=A0AA35PV03_9SAUR|nr:semaphorin-4A [Podarcis lilfordi]